MSNELQLSAYMHMFKVAKTGADILSVLDVIVSQHNEMVTYTDNNTENVNWQDISTSSYHYLRCI